MNLSAIARAASSFGVTRLITCGQSKLARTSAAFLPPREQAAMTPGTSLDLVQIAKIAREAKAILKPEEHRTMAPVLKKLKAKGYRIVALEQTTTSVPLFDFKFKEKTVLVVGNERKVHPLLLLQGDKSRVSRSFSDPFNLFRGFQRRYCALRMTAWKFPFMRCHTATM